VFAAMKQLDGMRTHESGLQRPVHSASELVHRGQRSVRLGHPVQVRLEHVQTHGKVEP